jgi:hypothetical protein
VADTAHHVIGYHVDQQTADGNEVSGKLCLYLCGGCILARGSLHDTSGESEWADSASRGKAVQVQPRLNPG